MENQTIPGHLFTWTRTRNGHLGVTEASSIGFPPGVWPITVSIQSHRTGMVKVFHKTGNATLFDDGPVVGLYRSDDDIILYVYND